MRTTVRLPERLMDAAKRAAVERGTTLTAVIEDSLRVALEPPRRRPASRQISLTTFGAGGLLPGVDLDDTASLLDFLEDSDSAP